MFIISRPQFYFIKPSFHLFMIRACMHICVGVHIPCRTHGDQLFFVFETGMSLLNTLRVPGELACELWRVLLSPRHLMIELGLQVLAIIPTF